MMTSRVKARGQVNQWKTFKLMNELMVNKLMRGLISWLGFQRKRKQVTQKFKVIIDQIIGNRI